MAWEIGVQKRVQQPDIISELKALKGELTLDEAKAHLGKMLRYNLGFTWKLVSGQELFLPFQEIILNSWFSKDYSLFVAGRGVGKSYLLAIFICLYALFHPGIKIVLVANNFRRVKDIFLQMEKFLNHKGASLLRQCFELKSASSIKMSKQTDQYLLNCANGSTIKGLPLGVGENLRGERANVLIIDEGLLISEHIQETILRPFLTAKDNAGERLKIREQEDALIRAGKMTEAERTEFANNKLIITSSASYQFEYLYEGIFIPYIRKILGQVTEHAEDTERVTRGGEPTYCVARMSYEAVPPDTILDESVLKAAKETRTDNPVFKREYCAEFIDSSDGYFNVKKLHECTIKGGDVPTTQVYGMKGSQYILAIDPAYGESRANDFFAMGVYMIIPEDRRIVQVHSYGKAGADIKEHYEYLTYLLTNFNIVYTVIDASGTEFIDGYNESSIAKSKGVRLGFLKEDFELEGEDYVRAVHDAKAALNVSARNFVYAQKFSSSTNRRMNEYLQGGIAAKKVWFASKIEHHEGHYAAATQFEMPFQFKDENGEPYTIVDFLSDQDDWIDQTKRQLALIEVKATGLGTLQYDIPSHLKKSKSFTRARRDNYTCLLMAYYASKHYFDILFLEDKIEPTGFTPIFL